MAFDLSNDDRISPWWRYGVGIVTALGFSILLFITNLAYDNVPPIPEKVLGHNSELLFSKADILNGQKVFFKYNLMEHGTLWGHGAYLGPDYTAEYLHQEGESIKDYLSKNEYHKDFKDLPAKEQGAVLNAIPELLKKNRFDPETQQLVFTEAEKDAYGKALKYWASYFSTGPAPGLPEGYITDTTELRDLTSFFSWAAWAAAANRPGESFTYTNNFPYDPLVGNYPSTDAYFWSAMSLIALLGGIGVFMFIFGRFDFLGWGRKDRSMHVHETCLTIPPLTGSQAATGKYFVAVGLMFLLQALAGGALAHYRVETTFYNLPIADWLPYNLLRTWHLQLAIFWIATAWIGGGLFFAPLLSGHEARNQKLGVNLLFWALCLVVFGSLFGEFLSSRGLLGDTLWFWVGNQGSEYLDLGRAWQYLLIAGFFLWLLLLYRGLQPAMRNPQRKEIGLIFFLSAATIPFFYIPAIFYDYHTNYSIIDNWRFWIIHLWVEGFFEVFATVLVAAMFVQMGITRLSVALRVIYLDAILYLGSGVVGTGHHWYFTGQTNVNMALSACFSAMEVVPLTILTIDAWDFIKVASTKCEKCGSFLAARQRWTIYFLISVGVWNFVGAGIFGFLINLPVISYFEVGTSLTPNHGHAAMFGVFGMLAMAVTMFCLRAQQTESLWLRTRGLIKTSFWGLNLGMALMLLIDLFPAGVLQLWDAIENGYWHARNLEFTMTGTYHMLEWIRILADTIFIAAGVIPMVLAILMTYTSRERRLEANVEI